MQMDRPRHSTKRSRRLGRLHLGAAQQRRSRRGRWRSGYSQRKGLPPRRQRGLAAPTAAPTAAPISAELAFPLSPTAVLTSAARVQKGCRRPRGSA